MNNPRITPLEQLRIDKHHLKATCRTQEAQLLTTLEYMEDNLIPIALRTTVQTLTNPGRLISGNGGAEASQGHSTGGWKKGILGFILSAALGIATKGASNRKSSLPEKIIGSVLPIAAPVASLAWGLTQPFIMSFVKKRVKSLFSWKKKK
jgi:hypothetical protein